MSDARDPGDAIPLQRPQAISIEGCGGFEVSRCEVRSARVEGIDFERGSPGSVHGCTVEHTRDVRT